MAGLFDSRLVFVGIWKAILTLLDEPLESPFNQMIKRLFDLSICLPALIFIFLSYQFWLSFFKFFNHRVHYSLGKKGWVWEGKDSSFGSLGLCILHPRERDESVQAHSGDERIFSFGK